MLQMVRHASRSGVHAFDSTAAQAEQQLKTAHANAAAAAEAAVKQEEEAAAQLLKAEPMDEDDEVDPLDAFMAAEILPAVHQNGAAAPPAQAGPVLVLPGSIALTPITHPLPRGYPHATVMRVTMRHAQPHVCRALLWAHQAVLHPQVFPQVLQLRRGAVCLCAHDAVGD